MLLKANNKISLTKKMQQKQIMLVIDHDFKNKMGILFLDDVAFAKGPYVGFVII
jgi:hypothetical protein